MKAASKRSLAVMGGVSRGGGCRREQWQVERPGKQLWSVVPGMRGDASRKSGNGNEDRPPQRPLSKGTLGTATGLDHT